MVYLMLMHIQTIVEIDIGNIRIRMRTPLTQSMFSFILRTIFRLNNLDMRILNAPESFSGALSENNYKDHYLIIVNTTKLQWYPHRHVLQGRYLFLQSLSLNLDKKAR